MRLDELHKVNAEVAMRAMQTVLDSMPGQRDVDEITVWRLPEGAVDAVVEAMGLKFHQLFRQIRGGDLPPELVRDEELFRQHLMALQTVLVVTFAIGHTCGEATRTIGQPLH